MFVKNKENLDFKYRKNGYLALLKANTVSYVDETKVTAKELLACYGQRIDIISRDLAVEIAPHVTKEEKKIEKASKKVEAPKKVETVKKEDLNDSFIEQILGEIEGEKGEAKAETCEHGKPCDGTCEECDRKAASIGVATTPVVEGTKQKATKAKATKAKVTKPRAKRGSKAKKA